MQQEAGAKRLLSKLAFEKSHQKRQIDFVSHTMDMNTSGEKVHIENCTSALELSYYHCD